MPGSFPIFKRPGQTIPFAFDDQKRYAGILQHAFYWTLATLTTGSKPFRIYNTFDILLHITKVTICVGTAPTGSALIVDIHKNNTTIFTNQAHRPQIAAAAFKGTTILIDVPLWDKGQFLTFDIDQVGSTIAGANLTVCLMAQ